MITPFAIILLGFFLGMRHATDPDHVIAVTTIVSRQRSMLHASLIGILWGIGHTITIFVIGTAIIVFGVVIPARVDLSMELSVGLMLILLGILILSSICRRRRSCESPLRRHQCGSEGSFAVWVFFRRCGLCLWVSSTDLPDRQQ
jgi:high-affinity nickel-transport protein